MKELKRVAAEQIKKYPKFQKPKVTILPGHDPLRRVIIENLESRSQNTLSLELSELPPSANQLYEKSAYKYHKTQNYAVAVQLDPKQVAFRIRLRNNMVNNRLEFKPKGVMYVVVDLVTEEWLNKDFTAKQKDLDNMIKPLFDAFQEAYRVPDELVFAAFVFKSYGPEKTSVKFFDVPAEIYQG